MIFESYQTGLNHHQMKKILLLLAFTANMTLLLRGNIDTIPHINSGAVIEQAIALHDEGAYEEAIQLYLQVAPGDTNYIHAQYEATLSYAAIENYEEAKRISEKFIQVPSSSQSLIYNNYGSMVDDTGDPQRAIEIFDEALAKYPYHTSLQYNKGVTLFKLGKYQLAQAAFQNVLRLSPFHAKSHYYLGKISEYQGHWSKALMSWQLYLAVNRNDNTVLVSLDNLLSGTSRESGIIQPFEENAFKTEDHYLKSFIARQDAFQTKVVFNTSAVYQAELFYEVLNKNSTSEDFWTELYVPFYKSLYENDQYTEWGYYLLESTNNEKIISWLKEHQEKVDAVISLASEKIGLIRDFGRAEINGEKGIYQFWYYDNKQVNAIGRENEKGENVGPFEFYYANGQLESKGNYNKDGKSDGEWTFYKRSGEKDRIENYKNGVLHGPYVSYFPNGEIEYQYAYVDGIVHSDIYVGYPCGATFQKKTFVDGKVSGKETVFYKNGQKSFEGNYVDGLLAGDVKSYSANGQVSIIYQAEEGEVNGDYTAYFEDGKTPSEKGFFESGKEQGIWDVFSREGHKVRSFTFKDGVQLNDSKFYNDSILVEYTEYNDSSELHGAYIINDLDGVKSCSLHYENGKLRYYGYWDKSGSLIEEGTLDEAPNTVKFYTPNGRLKMEIEMKDGLKNGKQKVYYRNGALESEMYFKEGALDGPYTTYHKNGKIKSSETYKNDMQDGYYQQYYTSGDIEVEGWFKGDARDQLWHYYYPNGALMTTESYYAKELHGEVLLYDFKGRRSQVKKFENGVWSSSVLYDTTGMSYMEFVDLDQSSSVVEKFASEEKRAAFQTICGSIEGTITRFYKNGNARTSSTYVNNNLLGNYRAYSADGTLNFQTNFVPAGRHGLSISYHDNGKEEIVVQYNNGNKNETTKVYYENGQLESVCTYVNENKVGQCSYYDREGHLQLVKDFDTDGEMVSYGYEQQGAEELKIIQVTEGDFELKSYFKNGQLSAHQIYKDNQLHGDFKMFANNGNLIEHEYYEFGDREGPMLVYHDSGKLFQSYPYKGDKLNGVSKTYYKNGQLKNKITWYHGMQNGLMIKYDEQGSVIYVEYYINDEEY